MATMETSEAKRETQAINSFDCCTIQPSQGKKKRRQPNAHKPQAEDLYIFWHREMHKKRFQRKIEKSHEKKA